MLSSATKAIAQQTFPPYRRIRNSTDFELVFRAASLNNKWFTVYVRKNEHGFSRLGLIASKRIMPNAVSRNFAKRLIREVFRCFFSAEHALDVVVRAKRQLNQENATEGRLALMQLLQAAKK